MTHSGSAGIIGFAHRGARAECQDNTLVSFARALALGARALETDAWVSADGIVVLDHGGEVRRGLRRYPMRSLGRDALPGHVPSLFDLYRTCGTAFELSVDVKDAAAAAPLLADARQAGAAARLWLCSPDLGALRAWRTLDADAHLVHSTTLRHLTGLRHPYGDGSTKALMASLGAHADRLAEVGVAALNLHHQAWSAPTVAAVQDRSILAFAWDAQSVEVLNRLVAMGLDGIYSDHVSRMLNALR